MTVDLPYLLPNTSTKCNIKHHRNTTHSTCNNSIINIINIILSNSNNNNTLSRTTIPLVLPPSITKFNSPILATPTSSTNISTSTINSSNNSNTSTSTHTSKTVTSTSNKLSNRTIINNNLDISEVQLAKGASMRRDSGLVYTFLQKSREIRGELQEGLLGGIRGCIVYKI
jgi:hypothetical protein